MELDDKLFHAVAYFKERPGLHRMLVKVKEKYQSLNHLGGSIQLNKLTAEERVQLGAYFQKSLEYQKSFTVQVSKIENRLSNTRFEGISFKAILDAYFEENIIGNQLVKEQFFQKREEQFQKYLHILPEGKGKQWVEKQLERDGAVRRYFFQKYNENESNCFRHLLIIVPALNALPYENVHPKKVAQFSTEMAGDPHFFDVGTEGEKWLTFVLAAIKGIPLKDVQTAEKRAELYFLFGLIRDTLFNFTFCYHIDFFKKGRIPHQGIRGYNVENEAQIVTLETLSRAEEVICHEGCVYVVENPTVFHALIQEHNNNQAVSLICINGHPNISSLLLLDLISKAGQKIYYGGDFDPEGLRIAENLKSRYGNQLQFWRYSLEDYRNALSKQELSSSRLKKLEALKSEPLKSVARVMKELKKAGYQEAITDFYIKDINSLRLISDFKK